MLILTSQIVAGIYASAMDFKYPFSQSREVAEYIKKQGLEDVPRVGIIDYAITPIMAYLKGSTYFFQGARFGTFTLFDKRRLEVMGTIPQYMLKGSILYIFTDNIQLEDSKIIKLKEFKDSIVEDETYYLYLKPAG
jgi:hypothetical protein